MQSNKVCIYPRPNRNEYTALWGSFSAPSTSHYPSSTEAHTHTRILSTPSAVGFLPLTLLRRPSPQYIAESPREDFSAAITSDISPSMREIAPPLVVVFFFVLPDYLDVAVWCRFIPMKRLLWE